MDFVCRSQRLRLKNHLEFDDLHAAHEMGFMQWSEPSEILLKTGGDPQGVHTPCRNPKEC